MVIPKAVLPELCDWLSDVYGISIILKNGGDEYARFMLDGRFFFVVSAGPALVKVHCTDRKKLDEIEALWTDYFVQNLKISRSNVEELRTVVASCIRILSVDELAGVITENLGNNEVSLLVDLLVERGRYVPKEV